MIIGAQLYGLREYTKTLEDFKETLKKVADMGYTSVQVSGTCPYEGEWLAGALKETGLTCDLTHYSFDEMKADAKAVVEKLVGKEYVVPLIQAYDSFDDIDFDKLPNQFVLKTNHDSGGYIICKDKAELDIEKARKKMNKSLKRNYYEFSREWPYKNVKPKLFAEEYIVGKDGTEMKDYKIFCFDGEPKFGFVVEGRTSKKMKIGFFDTDFKLIPVKQGGKKYDMAQSVEKPYNFEKMLELAKILTKDMPFVRMDFIEVDDKLYVGEFTFYHWGGRMAFEPEKYDEIFGSYIKLPEKKIID